jgi:hypothetical protein
MLAIWTGLKEHFSVNHGLITTMLATTTTTTTTTYHWYTHHLLRLLLSAGSQHNWIQIYGKLFLLVYGKTEIHHLFRPYFTKLEESEQRAIQCLQCRWHNSIWAPSIDRLMINILPSCVFSRWRSLGIELRSEHAATLCLSIIRNPNMCAATN